MIPQQQHDVIFSSSSSSSTSPFSSTGTGTSSAAKTVHYGHLFSTFLDLPSTTNNKRHCKRMIVLRNPIDRVISHFYYWNTPEEAWNMFPHIFDHDNNVGGGRRHNDHCDAHPDDLRGNFNQFSKYVLPHRSNENAAFLCFFYLSSKLTPICSSSPFY